MKFLGLVIKMAYYKVKLYQLNKKIAENDKKAENLRKNIYRNTLEM